MYKRKGVAPLEIKISNRRSKKFLTGFTLIELLVVIAIIALLMAILMPALQRVKKQAQDIRCRAHLKQWGVIFAMYTSDNENKFMHWNAGVWVEPLRPYYKDGGEAMRTCPTATRSLEEGALPTFAAWDMVNQFTKEEEIYRGSFGINNWLYDRPPGTESSALMWGHPSTNNWRTTQIKNSNNVPLFLDCWRWGGAPYHTSEPPASEEVLTDGFGRYCLNRHNGRVNGCFVDFTVRAIGLKELWTLKWHREYNTNGHWTTAGGVRPTNWPEWMRGFKNY